MKVLFKSIMLLTVFFFFQNTSIYGKSQNDIYIKISLWSNKLIVMEGNKEIKQYPIASGNDKTPTPIGTFKVVEKSKDWGGGFGTRWLGLNVPWGDYGIHGTNKPTLIGKNVSSGCIRMHNNHVEDLYNFIAVGTKVVIEGSLTGSGEREYSSIAFGSKGNLVQLVQNRLKAMELYHGPIDGIFDHGTERAVKKFQKINGLPVTGGVSKREYRLMGLME
ncbi:L,D-transpeptidase family protein [Bacillus sp. FJAT-27225]|uniref:L,D-transpeptidase family protein n=1 Tax=Bacillus sp. FJAT-27225 TaxID=1743144 RepID=UPI000AA11634|nr:L,D-transpeptidase family protein [Bacillus sp. FJAT-27225]